MPAELGIWRYEMGGYVVNRGMNTGSWGIFAQGIVFGVIDTELMADNGVGMGGEGGVVGDGEMGRLLR